MDHGVGNCHVSGIIVTDGRIAMSAMGDQWGANTPLGDDLLHQAIASIIATHETDLDQALAESNFGIKDALAGGCGGRQGFFTEHWLAGWDRRPNESFLGRTRWGG